MCWCNRFLIAVFFSGMFFLSCRSPHTPGLIESAAVRLSTEDAQRQAALLRDQTAAEIDSGLVLSLWASDSLVADPVALDMDDLGRAFFTRTNRRRTSEFDIRRHREWELESLSFEDVEDRRAFLRKTLTPEKGAELGKPLDLNGDSLNDWRDLLVESEQVFRVEDLDNDGIGDFSQLVATGFQEEVTDIAGGVLFHEDHLYVGVAPDVWRLADKDGDGIMDEKESISHGFQVHIGFGGHNLSGLIMGPDGRIYWGIGDIGFNGIDKSGKRWSYPNEGVIVRCNPDGTNFEVFAHGLRNTHEFVFDQYGNMISVDNDGDHPGESERLIYIVEGADAGWRINWQFGKYNDPKNNDYKVWMDEALNIPRHENQAAHIVPCIKNYINGPTGMLYNPGTALDQAWKDHFFVVEFNGNPARSGIHAFRLKAEGAGMTFIDTKKILSGVLATGLDVGPDGALYFTDWIDGWEKKNYGRIWKLDVEKNTNQKIRDETQTFLSEDFDQKNNSELTGLLGHVDMRIRQKAQFALVKKDAADELLGSASADKNQLKRIHAFWGLGQMIRKEKISGKVLMPFLKDPDPEVRSQVCKLIGDVRYKEAATQLLPCLDDKSDRVAFFAVEALGRIEYRPAVQPIIELLRRNNDRDVYLRHAATLALSRIGEVDPIVDLAGSDNRALRIAAVVTLRLLRHPSLARFLKDQDEFVVTEAARAINDDLSVESALPQLADLLNETQFGNEALVRRAINANLRVGNKENIRNLLNYASNDANKEVLRIEALRALSTWINPSVCDRVDGRYRGVINRPAAQVREESAPALATLMGQPNKNIRIDALRTVTELGISDIAENIENTFLTDRAAEVRAEAFWSLVKLDPDKAKTNLKKVLLHEKESVRIKAMESLEYLDVDSDDIADLLNDILIDGSSLEKQSAMTAFKNLPDDKIAAQLTDLLDLLLEGKIEGSLQLDLLEVAHTNRSEIIDKKIKTFRDKFSDKGELANYIECLDGGNVRSGQRILVNNSAAQCLKCHAIRGYGGVAGPPLDEIATKYSSEYLLQSLVDPSAHLAAGYGVVTLSTDEGKTISGILESENEVEIIVRNSDNEEVKVSKTNIVERLNAISSMPPMGSILSKREIRDLLALLVTFKEKQPPVNEEL